MLSTKRIVARNVCVGLTGYDARWLAIFSPLFNFKAKNALPVQTDAMIGGPYVLIPSGKGEGLASTETVDRNVQP